MTSSDIIAIVAVIVSAIVSIVSGVISYKNNKASLEARRSDLAFEKRLDAFKEVVVEIGKIQAWLINWASLGIKDMDDWNKFFGEFTDHTHRFLSCYYQQIVYLPPSIAQFLAAQSLVMNGNVEKIKKNGPSKEILREWSQEYATMQSLLISSMQKFIGYT